MKKSRYHFTFLIVVCLFQLFPRFVLGQAVTNASNTDNFLDIHNYSYPCSTDAVMASASTVNVDMLEVTNGYKLWAVAYTADDDAMKDPSTSCTLYTSNPATRITGVTVRYTGPNPFPSWARDLDIPNAERPDIVLGNTNLGAGDFILGVVYNSTNGIDVELVTAPMSNVSTGTATLGSLSSPITLNDPMNGRIARDPHIDLYGNVNSYYQMTGIHSLDHFVAVWTEHDPNSGVDYIMMAIGDLNNPLGFARVQITPNIGGDPQGVLPDVAASGGCGAGCGDNVWITYIDPANSDALMRTYVAINTGSPIVTGHSVLASGYSSILAPRIECIAAGYNPLSGESDWQIVASIDNGSGYYDVYSYNNVPGSLGVNTIQVASNENHFSPVVAGVGEDMDPSSSGRVGETNFSVAYYSTSTNNSMLNNGDVYANSIGLYTGNMAGAYYEVNSSDMGQAAAFTSQDDIPVAITSSSNTGNDLLTVWFHGDGYYHWKFSGNSYSYKPNNINERKLKECTLFPNPVLNNTNISNAEGSKYMLTDIAGRIVASGIISSDSYLMEMTKYTPGIYILDLNQNGDTRKFKIVKQ